MNIKDYLKYYIGCDVIMDGEHRGNFRGGSLIPNTIDQIYYDIHDYKSMKFEGVDFSMPYNDDTSEDCRIKPILRRIESLTEAEMIGLLQSIVPSNMEDKPTRDDYSLVMFYNDGGNLVDEDVAIGANYSCRCYEGQIAIRKNGDIDFFDEEGNRERVSNLPQSFHYLLSLGIDLFGLINAGLAVDAATINQQDK